MFKSPMAPAAVGDLLFCFFQKNAGKREGVLIFLESQCCLFSRKVLYLPKYRKNMAKLMRDIGEFNALFHQPTLHPFVSVGDLAVADSSLFEPTDFDMYCVMLLEQECGKLTKDGKPISYKVGTVVTVMPGQTMMIQVESGKKPQGKMLAFRPELLIKTGLGRDFYMFGFFSYDAREALELSAIERGILQNCFANIIAELHTANDHLTGHMLRLGIGQLLSYCKRFYERQFVTQRKTNSDVVEKLSSLLDNYLSSGLPEQKGQPTVAWCAQQFNWSPNYFGDVIKRELHITAQEYVQGKIIEVARNMLSDTNMSVTEIAQQLGFTYPNHFTRLFRRKVGLSPSQYRMRV